MGLYHCPLDPNPTLRICLISFWWRHINLNIFLPVGIYSRVVDGTTVYVMSSAANDMEIQLYLWIKYAKLAICDHIYICRSRLYLAEVDIIRLKETRVSRIFSEVFYSLCFRLLGHKMWKGLAMSGLTGHLDRAGDEMCTLLMLYTYTKKDKKFVTIQNFWFVSRRR